MPEIVRVGDVHGKTPSQMAIRLALQHNSVTIPRSVKPARITENADVFSFELTPEQMQAIDRLDRDQRIGPTSRAPPRQLGVSHRGSTAPLAAIVDTVEARKPQTVIVHLPPPNRT